MKTILYSLSAILALSMSSLLSAGDLTYSPANPQTGDSELVIAHKNAVNIAAMATGYSITGFSKSHIATNTTVTSKTGAGILHAITVSTKGATGNIATVYDNTAGSGTVIAVIDTTAGPATLVYDVAFTTGLTIVTATGTAADLTVAWR
jgi:hypothetical protein